MSNSKDRNKVHWSSRATEAGVKDGVVWILRSLVERGLPSFFVLCSQTWIQALRIWRCKSKSPELMSTYHFVIDLIDLIILLISRVNRRSFMRLWSRATRQQHICIAVTLISRSCTLRYTASDNISGISVLISIVYSCLMCQWCRHSRTRSHFYRSCSTILSSFSSIWRRCFTLRPTIPH